MRHDFFLATKGADRHAAADHFTQASKVRVDAEMALGAVRSEAEARHDFVENKDCAMRRTALACPLNSLLRARYSSCCQ